MAAKKPAAAAVNRRVAKISTPQPNATGQIQPAVPKGYYRPGVKDTTQSVANRYHITAAQLAALNPGYKMSAGFGARANPLKVRSYAKPIPGAPKIVPPSTAPNPAAPKPMTTDEWLGQDTAYQDYLSQSGLADTGEQASLLRRRNDADTTKTQALRTLADANPSNRTSLSEQMAARGMDQSGAMGNALLDLSNKYNQDVTDVGSAYTKTKADLQDEETGYNFDKSQALTAAQQAALRRRAARYGTELTS